MQELKAESAQRVCEKAKKEKREKERKKEFERGEGEEEGVV